MSRLYLLVVCSLFLTAQTPDTATVQGHIADQTHAANAGVHVTATNTLTGLKRSAESDNSGNFSIGGLPIDGTYDIAAIKADSRTRMSMASRSQAARRRT